MVVAVHEAEAVGAVVRGEFAVSPAAAALAVDPVGARAFETCNTQ